MILMPISYISINAYYISTNNWEQMSAVIICWLISVHNEPIDKTGVSTKKFITKRSSNEKLLIWIYVKSTLIFRWFIGLSPSAWDARQLDVAAEKTVLKSESKQLTTNFRTCRKTCFIILTFLQLAVYICNILLYVLHI